MNNDIPRIFIISQPNAKLLRQDSVLTRGTDGWIREIVSNLMTFTHETYYYVKDGVLSSPDSNSWLNIIMLGKLNVLFQTDYGSIIGIMIYYDGKKIYNSKNSEKLDFFFCNNDHIHFHIIRGTKSPYYLTFDLNTGQPLSNNVLPHVHMISSTNYTLTHPYTQIQYGTLNSDGKALVMSHMDDVSWYVDKLLYTNYKTKKYRIFGEFDFEWAFCLTDYYKRKLVYQLWLLKKTPLASMPDPLWASEGGLTKVGLVI